MSDSECSRKGKWFRGCQFEPRYDTRLPDRKMTFEAVNIGMVEALKDRIYVADVCTTCGKVIKRGGAHDGG